MIGAVLVTALGIGSYIYLSLGTSTRIESIAVMPFANETGDPDLEYLSDGLTETLIGRLSQLSGLSVKTCRTKVAGNANRNESFACPGPQRRKQ